MKKRIVLLAFLLLVTFTQLNAEENITLYAGVDLSCVQSTFLSHLYVSCDVGATIEKDLSVEIPLSLYVDQSGGGEILLESSVNILVYPWSTGPYISLSLIDFLLFIGDFTPNESIHYLSTIGFGYRWEINDRISLSPQITLVDPSLMYEETVEYIQGFIPTFSKVTVSLSFHYAITTLSIED